ncbi:MAG TPA: hypothetical protein VGM91_10440 [Conexibacter sp.]|jgi:hypothetical protein
MSLPEPETQGHAAAQGARVAVERGNLDSAVSSHLAGGIAWAADEIVELYQRVAALEQWAAERGYTPPAT